MLFKAKCAIHHSKN